MNKKKLYPITISMLRDHSDMIPEIFLAARPHKGAFLGVSELDGSFLCDNAKEIFESFQLGEKLYVSVDRESKISVPPLSVYREDKTFLGTLPYGASIFPNLLLKRGVNIWCHAEAASFDNDLLSIAVSIYCEEY